MAGDASSATQFKRKNGWLTMDKFKAKLYAEFESNCFKMLNALNLELVFLWCG